MDNEQANAAPASPLADRMRPRTLDEFIGQSGTSSGQGRLLAPGHRGRPADLAPSFAGPPGMRQDHAGLHHCARRRSAAFVQAQRRHQRRGRRARGAQGGGGTPHDSTGQATYLLLDECHRWSKAQSGLHPSRHRAGDVIRFIGSTTENPDGRHDRRRSSAGAGCSSFDRLDRGRMCTGAMRRAPGGSGAWLRRDVRVDMAQEALQPHRARGQRRRAHGAGRGGAGGADHARWRRTARSTSTLAVAEECIQKPRDADGREPATTTCSAPSASPCGVRTATRRWRGLRGMIYARAWIRG